MNEHIDVMRTPSFEDTEDVKPLKTVCDIFNQWVEDINDCTEEQGLSTHNAELTCTRKEFIEWITDATNLHPDDVQMLTEYIKSQTSVNISFDHTFAGARVTTQSNEGLTYKFIEETEDARCNDKIPSIQEAKMESDEPTCAESVSSE